MKSFSGLLRKTGDILEYATKKDEVGYNMFRDHLPEGVLVEIYMDIQTDDGSLAQLAKIHAMVRQLSIHTGDSFEDMRLIIKRRAGLCIEKEIEGERFLYCKSLGKCNKEELSQVIQAIQEISQILEYPLQ